MIEKKKNRPYLFVPDEYHSCSVDELGDIMRNKIKIIQEYRQFLHSEEAQKYPNIRTHIRYSKWAEMNHLHWINKARHVLIETGYKHYHEVPIPKF